LLRRASERDDGRVLDEEQDVFGDFARYAGAGDGALVFERFGVRDQAEGLDEEGGRSGLGTRDSGLGQKLGTRDSVRSALLRVPSPDPRIPITHESSSRANPALPRRPL